MAHFPKPAAGSWTENYPELGTAPVDYTDSIDPAFFEAEREAIFKRTWLNVGRVERLPRTGSYFTKELPSAGPGVSVIVVKTKDGSIKAFHNMCRHRETSWCGTTIRTRKPQVRAANSPASTTPGATASTAS
ncbi:rieske domain protein [Mycobacterium xenopi 4042]|uniref:Rieske domain protein n=1 Tax=Mycobacterium xenopi 4042 TaxID=1299334 RepID=X8AHS7_MYCXE|nr:rieske domain protein [Mycobacterium xenopi 4042]